MNTKIHKPAKRIVRLLSCLLLAVLVAAVGVMANLTFKADNTADVINQKHLVIGPQELSASETIDYVTTGANDNVKFQAALNALPAGGGRIEVLPGTYSFSATVTRAINSVIITGVGTGTLFNYNGVNPIFTAGGNGWTFRDINTDAGGLSMGATTGWSWENVTIGATYYAYRTGNGSAYFGNLTSGRATVIGTNGLLTDNAGLTYSTTNSVTKVYAIGDSLTEAGSYESKLNSLIGAGYYVINKGISGNQSSDVLARLNVDVINPADAGYCIVWVGFNDINGGRATNLIEADLQSIYTALHNAGIKVIAVNVSPFKGYVGWNAGKQTATDDVNTWIAGTAINIDNVIDVYSVLEDPANPDQLLPAYAAADKIHLTRDGYEAVGSAIDAGVVWAASNHASTFVLGTIRASALEVPDIFKIVGPNIGIGQDTLRAMTTGYSNVAIGSRTQINTTSGYNNISVGDFTLYNNTIGYANVAIGVSALKANTQGYYNIGIGNGALLNETTGSNNVIIGGLAGATFTTGYDNVGIGALALYSNDSAGSTAIGSNSLKMATGTQNTAFGYYSGQAITTGAYNTAIGIQSLYTQTTTNGNVALGYQAGYYETGANKLFIDNQKRANEGDARVKALIYGVFDANTDNQSVTVNAKHVNFGLLPTYANNAAALAGGLVAGDLYRVNAGVDPEPVYIVH